MKCQPSLWVLVDLYPQQRKGVTNEAGQWTDEQKVQAAWQLVQIVSRPLSASIVRTSSALHVARRSMTASFTRHPMQGKRSPCMVEKQKSGLDEAQAPPKAGARPL
eukprot:2704792-Amphidinium_carterae.2